MQVSPASERLLADLLRARTGQEMPDNRLWRIGSALAGLCRENGLASVDGLVANFSPGRHDTLARRVVEALLNNETYFFRDRAFFDHLSTQILPAIAKERAASRTLAIWSVGCSTGQEALTLAMIFAEQETRWAGWQIQILATDVSGAVIEYARKGCYSPFQVQRGLAMGQTLGWFEQSTDGWRANEKLRRMIRFEEHNLLDPLPASGTSPASFDLVLCRNVLLYFDAPTREKAFARLADSLSPKGWLMLGAGETTIGLTDRLAPVREAPGFYRHVSAIKSRAQARRQG